MVLPSQTGINVFRPSLFLALVMGLVLGLSACGGGGDVAPTPDVPASVQAGIAEALATPTPDISATVEAGVEATIQASQSSTHVPPTPSLEVLIQQARPSVVLIETDVAGGLRLYL